ncbi:hypothetical protein PENTCL1PPCAC_4644, partial [Pristionchus entomophagus]
AFFHHRHERASPVHRLFCSSSALVSPLICSSSPSGSQWNAAMDHRQRSARDASRRWQVEGEVDRKHVLLQMPVMNSRYAAKDENGNRSKFGNASNRKTFNPSWIMREHHDFPFGSFTLNRVS